MAFEFSRHDRVYGTEHLFAGGVDPGNREDMFVGNAARDYPAFDTSNPRFDTVRQLIALRKQHTALRRGDLTLTWTSERPRGSLGTRPGRAIGQVRREPDHR